MADRLFIWRIGIKYEILNATEQEEILISNIIEFIIQKYSSIIDIEKPRVIEIVAC